jgi:hypothetical protein
MGSTKKNKSIKRTNDELDEEDEDVSSVRAEDIVAIVCSCIHLSHKPPIARSAEPDWYEAMDIQLHQLRRLEEKHGCPVLCCGDIFDRWDRAPPELINFAIQKLPTMYAVPGQHDLPDHSYDHIKRSPYWTLVEAGVVINLNWEDPVCHNSIGKRILWLYGFPFGFDIEPHKKNKNALTLCIAHSYIWMGKTTKYPGAPKNQEVSNYFDVIDSYDLACFGDNHKGFLCMTDSTRQEGAWVFNCGTFMRRKADEFNYEPQVGLITKQGTVIPHKLDCSGDKFIDVEEALALVERAIDATDFLEELIGLGQTAVDFIDAVKQFCERNGVSRRVTLLVENALRKDK